MNSAAILVCLALTLAGVAILLGSAAVFHHASVFFSVTVPGEFVESDRAHKIVRKYRISLGSCAAAAALMTCFGVIYGKPLLIGLAPLVLVGAGIVSFVIARRAVLPSAAPVSPPPNIGVPASHSPVSAALWIAIAAPFGILLIAGLWLAAHRAAIPARFPVHWGISGRPDRFASPGWRELYGFNILGLEICTLLASVAWAISRYAPWRSGWNIRFNRAMLRVLAGAMWIMALLFSYIALSPLYGPPAIPILIPLLVIAVVALILPLTRVSSSPDAESASTPDDRWTAGVFYFNRDDPALLVQKRFGIGYTFNFARPVAWAALGLTLLIPITALILF